MVTKLKLVFQNPQSTLAFKTLIFGGFWIWVRSSQAGTLPVLFFLAVTILMYTRPLFRTIDYLVPAALLLGESLLAARLPLQPYYISLPIALYLGLLFYVILGLKDLILIRKYGWRRLLSVGLAYPIFLLFFYYSYQSWLPGQILFLGSLFLLLKDLLKNRLMVWLLVLLIFEGVFAVSLLPISFISSATLSLLMYCTLLNIADQYLRTGGQFSKKFALVNFTIFLLLLVLIFISSSWAL